MAKAQNAHLSVMNGADYPRWQGQCSACHAQEYHHRGAYCRFAARWRNRRLTGYARNAGASKVQSCRRISLEGRYRVSPPVFKGFDRVLGGGVVPGSAIPDCGSPGRE